MTTALTWFAALGGLATFIAGMAVTLRAIFKQVNATDDNTKAVEALTKKIDEIGGQINNHEIRIDRLERK